MESDADIMRCPVADVAGRHPRQTAIVTDAGLAMSYSELDERVRRVMTVLQVEGIRAGDRLAMRAENSIDLIALLLACFRLKIVAVPLSVRLPPDGIDERARQVAAAAIVVDRGASSRAARTIMLPAIFDASPVPVQADATWALDSPATIIFTSGSTGEPKAVLHALAAHVYSALGSNRNIPLGPGDRWLLALPLYHVGGLAILFRCFLAGATVALPASGAPVASALGSLHPTHLSLVATQLKRLLDEDAPDLRPSVKAILLGGSAIPPGLIDRSVDARLPIHTSYGMTEMASQVATTPPGADRPTLATAGAVLPHREVRIQSGCILVRGRTRFLGYATEHVLDEPFDADGWFTTGDTGYFDPEGRLVITGRVDDMFISGGENIQPREIERALCAIGGIRDAVVVPVPDVEFGHRPFAFIEADHMPTPELLERHLREVLPGFMVPQAFHPMPPAPVDRLKISRQDLAILARRLAGRS